MSRSSSNSSLTRPARPAKLKDAPSSEGLNTKKVNEKGDVVCGEVEKRFQQLSPLQRKLSSVRKQRSDPVLSKGGVSAPNGSPPTVKTDQRIQSSARQSSSAEFVTASKETQLPKDKDAGTSEDVICEAFKDDPKLRSLCLSIGISLHPDTIIGPIEKGLIIIGVLQDSLNELIQLKVREARNVGKTFHIQQSGLDTGMRALENAERSLKTMKASKQPVLGRRTRSQQQVKLPQISQQQVPRQKHTEDVIRILTATKEKFDRMGNGLSRFMTGLTFLATRSGTPTLPLSSNTTAAPSRRTTGGSLLTTPVTPLSTTACTTRARSSDSSTSVGSGDGNTTENTSILI